MRILVIVVLLVFTFAGNGYVLAAEEGEGAGTGLAEQVYAYTVDVVHSTVIFKIKHSNISYFYGRFNKFSGTYSEKNGIIQGDSVKFEIMVESVDTANEGRDNHLRKPDFFSVKEFPVISFKGKSVKTSGNKFAINGVLSLHGVSKDISITLEKIGEGKNQRGEIIQGYEGSFTIKRSDFGMKYMLGPIGDEINLIIGIEARRN